MRENNKQIQQMKQAGKYKRAEQPKQKAESKQPKQKAQTPNGAEACPYAKKCGGCDYQGISYEKQLREKQEYVKKNVGSFCKVNPIVGM